jgi:uncharacterized protein YjlB
MPEILQLNANDWVPNSPHLPVLLYRRGVAAAGRDAAAAFEEVFERRSKRNFAKRQNRH